MEKQYNGFIGLTAKDYDMSYQEVENIYNKGNNSKYAVSFYEALEAFISERKRRRDGQKQPKTANAL